MKRSVINKFKYNKKHPKFIGNIPKRNKTNACLQKLTLKCKN